MEKDNLLINHREHGAKWCCIVHIMAYSHIIKEGIFNNWNEKVHLVKFKRITDRDIEMQIGIRPLKNKNALYTKAIMYAYTNLMALNISTCGHFWWPPAIWPFKITKAYDCETENDISFKIAMKKEREWGNNVLDEKDLANVMRLIVGMFGGGQTKLDETFFEFYALAMTFLSIANFEHQFYREIFSNFYKIIERLAVVNILHIKKLTNEVTQIKQAMARVGLREDIINEFNGIYQMRARDAMHSWGSEKPITFEEAGKCKFLCDYFLYNYLKNEADKLTTKKSRVNLP